MQTLQKHKTWLWILFTLLISTNCYSVEVIAPNDDELPHQVVDIHTLTDIFTRKTTTWKYTGKRIKVFTRPVNSIEHKLFVLELLGVTNYRYKKLLQQNTFSGKSSATRTVTSDEQMLITVGNTPNSIGYVHDYMILHNETDIFIIVVE